MSVVQFVPDAQVPAGTQLAGPAVTEVVQPAGTAGAVTPSKFSLKYTKLHGVTSGVGEAVALGVTVGVGEGVPGGVGVAVGVGVPVGVGVGAAGGP